MAVVDFRALIAFFQARFRWLFAMVLTLFLTMRLIFILQTSPGEILNSDYEDRNFKVSGLQIPDDLDFAGEKVPVENYKVKEAIEMELIRVKYWLDHPDRLIQYTGRYFPVIEKIFSKMKVPDDFKYIAFIESKFQNIVSPKGATGVWQFVESTGRKFGLQIDNGIDERYHVEKSTWAAGRFFIEAHERLGTWTAAANAYNLGMAGIERKLKEQKRNNTYEIRFNRETSRYIYKILALKIVYQYHILKLSPERFRIGSYRIPGKIIKIDSLRFSIPDLATRYNLDLYHIRQANPWIIGNVIENPDRKTYLVLIPKREYFNQSGALADSLFIQNRDSTVFRDTLHKLN